MERVGAGFRMTRGDAALRMIARVIVLFIV
jgi:hypothetical protein